jgi:hypothetical protein
MKVVDRKTVIHNMGNTRTIQHFNTLLGDKPHKLGLVATLYPDLAITVLTDALRNVYFNPKGSSSNFTPINAMSVQWDIDVNYIHKVFIAEDVTTSQAGLNKVPFTMILDQKYYDKNDTFTLENKQQLMVIAPPQQLSAKRWSHTVILVGNDFSKYIDPRFLTRGRYTRYRSNYHPELSERGYTKYMSNTETHRNYMSRHRASESVSADYKIREKVYLELSKKDKTEYYKMHRHEKDCMDTFMMAKNNSSIFSETNFDVNGKCLDQDEQGRDIPMGDGIIPQIERYCDKFLYSQLSSEVLDDVMAAMVEKSDRPTGNTYAVICNERLYNQFGKLQKDDYRFNTPNDGSFFYSKEKGNKIRTGAEFDSYTFQGNTITFMPDRALSQEYDMYGYGLFLDTTADLKSGRPNIASFTVEGSEMIEGYVNGMGGQDGKTSGTVSTGVHGSEYHILGYSCCVLFNPYKSFILKENVELL